MAAAAAAAAFEGAEDDHHSHHHHNSHNRTGDDDEDGLLAADLGIDGVSWPWEGGSSGEGASLAALKTAEAATAVAGEGALAALPPQQQPLAASAATNSGGGSNSWGVASQSQWTNNPSSCGGGGGGGADPRHGVSVSPRSEAGGGDGGTPTTRAEAGASAAPGSAFCLQSPTTAAAAAAPLGAFALASSGPALAPAAAAAATAAAAPAASAATAAVLSQFHAQHRSLLLAPPAAPVAGYRAAASTFGAGLFSQQQQLRFDLAAPSSAALAARAALSTADPSCLSSSAVAGPSVPDIPDAWAAAALCDELVDLGAHPGAHRGDPWRRRSLSFGDLAAAEAAALATAASAAAASASAAHVAETGHAAEVAAAANMRRFIRPATAVAAAAGGGGSSKRRFSTVGGRNSIEELRFGATAALPQSLHTTEAELLAAFLPMSSNIDCDEGAESDSGWTPAVAAARRRFDSERGCAGRGGSDEGAPPVALPQMKRARSVSCLSLHGLCGGLLPAALSKATAAAAAASRLHRDEALMFASMKMMQTSSSTGPSSPASSSRQPPSMPRLPPRLASQQKHKNPFSSSSAGSPHSTAAPSPPHQQPEEEEANPQPISLPPPPPGFWLTAPPIPKERGAQPDEVCWARLLSYPWWPAIVKHPPPASAFALRHKPESVFVVFFGDGNCAWLSPRSLDRFASGYSKRSAKPRKDLQKAVDEAWRALGVARPVAAAGGGGAAGETGSEELALPDGFDDSRPALAPQHF